MFDPLSFYKCLADDTRLQSLLLIQAETELCVCELTTALELSQPKVSRHLAQLREAELLLDRRQGQWVFYRINPQLPRWVAAVIKQTLEANAAYLSGSCTRLAAMGDRPARLGHCC
jgi:ArsR family transcriptional regulator